MASDRQREANRKNGRRGGPNTENGKQQSRLNALKHGLTAVALVVLPEEDNLEYEALLHGFRDSLAPVGNVEDALVLRLTQAHWRSLRARSVETSMLDTAASTHRTLARENVEGCPEYLHPHKAIGAGFLVMPPERWHTYLRYDASISRDFFKTLDTLIGMQRLRRGQTKPPLVRTAESGAGVSDSGIRFVSQNGAPAAQAETQA